MSKAVVAGQLSLFDLIEDEQAQDENDLTYTDKDFVPSAQYPHMPEYIVKQERWANGGSSPADLQDLAEALLDIGVVTFKDTRGDVYKYVAITTTIIDGKLWCAYQFDCKLSRYVPRSEDDDVDKNITV